MQKRTNLLGFLRLVTALTLLTVPVGSSGQSLQNVVPESAGFSSTGLDAVTAILQQHIPIQELLQLLPELVGLRTVKIMNNRNMGCEATVSDRTLQKLEKALKPRGGKVYYPSAYPEHLGQERKEKKRR